MSLPILLTKVGFAMKNFGGRTLLLAKAHAPEICIGAGIAGFCGTIGATMHATNETRDILDERERLIRMCDENFAYHISKDEYVEYSREDYEKDIKKVKIGARKKLIRAWFPVGTLGGASIMSILGGYKILNGRYVATVAAYKAMEQGFERYRENVIAKFGKEVDNEIRQLKAEELEEDRKQKETASRQQPKSRRKKSSWEKCGQHMIFDEYSEHWQRYWNGEMVMDYLRTKNNQLYDMLRLRGHLFGNEINDMLGLPRTSYGQVLGYIYTPGTEPEHHRDILGLDRLTPEQVRGILSTTRNEDIRVPLYPEFDGIVFDLIGKKDVAPVKLENVPDGCIVQF